ncbi:MAG: histidinol phosphate phosphatase domain-containing protein [Candidatus Omnitrophica bacterium]|nr:histidinol phosphate phosphatase domain-containing protein [Candidatus Omnitrophota bacterium]
MYNLHCHSLLSDGVLLPSEIAVRYLTAGYKTIAITDHADYSNIEFVIKSILTFTRKWPKNSVPINVLPGIELTHLPLEQFGPLVKYARRKGIKIVVGHGETQAEPVISGTNRAAILAGVDILAHPGLITEEDAQLAKKKNVFLEITSRQSHAATNAHVVKQALKTGANLILNMDAHDPQDIIRPQELNDTGIKAGLAQAQIETIFSIVADFVSGK